MNKFLYAVLCVVSALSLCVEKCAAVDFPSCVEEVLNSPASIFDYENLLAYDKPTEDCYSSYKELIEFFCWASEVGSVRLINDAVEAIVRHENSDKILLESLIKYCENGKADFALHKAIKDKNIIASILLAHNSADVNKRKLGCETVKIDANRGVGRPFKTPIELALDSDVVYLIPGLLIKKARPHEMTEVGFFYEGEEDLGYVEELGQTMQKFEGVENKEKVFVFVGGEFKRSLIGAAICKNRLDVVEMLYRMSVDLNNLCCISRGRGFKPLQLALAINRYDIAQFLVCHGAAIE
jgi:hypothetical protein